MDADPESALRAIPLFASLDDGSGVRCWALARKDFERLLEDNPTIAVRMLPALAERLADAT
ncbi:MAG TPA: hypothetical protein VF907_03815 [Actinomycetota bacterium]